MLSNVPLFYQICIVAATIARTECAVKPMTATFAEIVAMIGCRDSVHNVALHVVNGEYMVQLLFQPFAATHRQTTVAATLASNR